MYLSIIALPFLGSLVSGFLGRKVGVTGAHIVTCGSLILCSILISIAFYEVGLCGSPVNINLGSWLESELLTISWEFYFDQLTVSLGLAVVYCSTLIHIYSIDYLSVDPAMHCGKMLIRDKLSNSGDTLKLLIPSYK
jgi:NADH-ubiquinone oxidoreductase chain 5